MTLLLSTTSRTLASRSVNSQYAVPESIRGEELIDHVAADIPSCQRAAAVEVGPDVPTLVADEADLRPGLPGHSRAQRLRAENHSLEDLRCDKSQGQCTNERSNGWRSAYLTRTNARGETKRGAAQRGHSLNVRQTEASPTCQPVTGSPSPTRSPFSLRWLWSQRGPTQSQNPQSIRTTRLR